MPNYRISCADNCSEARPECTRLGTLACGLLVLVSSIHPIRPGQLFICAVVLVIYVDSIVFIMGASILSHGYDMELNKELCSKAILLCLACYMTTKVWPKNICFLE